MTKDILIEDWALFKAILKKALKNKDAEESYRLLESICQIGYFYNFLYQFKDDELEQNVYELTGLIRKQFETVPLTSQNPGKVIFYDFFTEDYRCFTQQYIDYFIKNNIEFLYIMHDVNYSEKKEIIQTLNNYSKASIYLIDTKNNKSVNHISAAYKKIIEYGANKIFIQNAPWDIFSYCIGVLLKDLPVQSYLINITDHAFWLGHTIFNYFIDFRKYGARINHFYRGIPLNNILIINTPAFIDQSVSFQGFPVNVENKVIGFGGGSIYKIKDEKNTYLNLIKILLKQNENFIFFFANVGDKNYVNDFVKKNNLQNRLVPIGNRIDISAIFKKIDIFFNTYPYAGGNMLSYAFQNNLPVVSLVNKKYKHSRIDQIFDINLETKYILESESQYLHFANKLIQSKEFRSEVSNVFNSAVNCRISFEDGLNSVFENTHNNLIPINLIKIEIDIDSDIAFLLSKSQFVPKQYFYLKTTILNSYFLLQLKKSWKLKSYWKNSFILSIKSSLKKRLPFLKKIKLIFKRL